MSFSLKDIVINKCTLSVRLFVIGGGMVLYIEYVLIDNLVIDYFLIRLLARIFKDKYKNINIILSLLIGVVGALILPYVNRYTVLAIMYRLLVAVLMITLLKRYNSIKSVITRLICFITCTALLAGLIIGALNALSIRYTISGVMLYDLELPMGLLLAFVVGAVAILDRGLRVILTVATNSKYMCDMVIEDKGSTIKIRGYYDSGNMVCVDGESVSIISIDSFMKLYKNVSIINLIDGNVVGLNKIKYISVGGITTKERLLSFVVDKVVLGGREYYGQRLAVTYKSFDEFDCILSSNYLGVVT